jgi:hypothetical protein
MSKKKKYLLILGVIIANLIVVIVLKNHGGTSGAQPYSLPSQAEVEREGRAIAERITAGDVNYLVSKYDLNAMRFFQLGVANWVDEAKQEEANRKLESSLVGVKSCRYKQQTSFNKLNMVLFELTFEDGKKQDAWITLYKDKRGRIGIAYFAIMAEL